MIPRLKAAGIHCLFFIAVILATAPMGALAVISSVMERWDVRQNLRAIRKANKAFERAMKKPQPW